MVHVLLIGAGFSRNWGGWLSTEVSEYLLGLPYIGNDPELRTLLWGHQSAGGFESALEGVQERFVNDPKFAPQLEAMQQGVMQMFDDMNGAFFSAQQFEFQNAAAYMVRPFLTRFDAIFSLNQDVLLEHNYLDNYDVSLASRSRWSGCHLPGMKQFPSNEPIFSKSRARAIWEPLPDKEYQRDGKSQPLFKLHGSSSWRSADRKPLVVIGGQKARAIGLHPILVRYFQEFEEHLYRGGVKLMVIGYGFRDAHINEVIARGVLDRGLRMFVVAPNGSDMARDLNPTRHPGMIGKKSDLEEVFERGLCGASRRPLSESFGGGVAEFNKLQRFFET